MGAIFSRANQEKRVIRTMSQLDEEIKLTFTNETPQAQSTDPTAQQHDQLISSFLEVAVGQTAETAKRFLETTNWNIEESINLFLFDKNYDPSSMYNDNHVAEQSHDETSDDDSTTFDDGETDSTLSSMYRPPVELLFTGRTFQEAKETSCARNLWLIVNLQSRTEFASHTLNRDLWANDAVSEAVMCSFVLWQVYDNTVEGQKISTFYKIDSAPPVVLVIDPVTGQKMGMWSGEIEAQRFVEDLSWISEADPHEQLPAPSWGEEFEQEDTWASSNNDDNNVAPSWGTGFEESTGVKEEGNELEFPVLSEEPKGDCDKSTVCSLCVRFPDGGRKQRRFLKTEPLQLLWSFCYSQMVESEKKAFKLVQAIPGASKTLEYGASVTFEESGLANSMVSVAWE